MDNFFLEARGQGEALELIHPMQYLERLIWSNDYTPLSIISQDTQGEVPAFLSLVPKVRAKFRPLRFIMECFASRN